MVWTFSRLLMSIYLAYSRIVILSVCEPTLAFLHALDLTHRVQSTRLSVEVFVFFQLKIAKHCFELTTHIETFGLLCEAGTTLHTGGLDSFTLSNPPV